MKKLFFIATLVATVGLASLTYAFSKNNQNKGLSEIQLAAIEVLSTDDDPGTDDGTCYTKINYMKNCKVLYCGECTKFVEGVPDPYSNTGKCF